MTKIYIERHKSFTDPKVEYRLYEEIGFFWRDLTKEELLELYRQITRILVDETVENFDPDKVRAMNESEDHKKQQEKENEA